MIQGSISREKLLSLTQEQKEDFTRAMRLARVLNSLRFSHRITRDALEDDTSAGSRDTVWAFIMACSVLYESKHAVQNEIEQKFRTNKSYRESKLRDLFDSDEAKTVDTICCVVRNNIGFHYNRDYLKTSIEKYQTNDDDKFQIFTATGSENNDFYYSFPEEAVFRSIFPDVDNNSILFQDAMKCIISYSKQLLTRGDTFICNLLLSYGLEIE